MKKICILIGAVIALLDLSGCAQLGYYAQAMQGQMQLVSSARPIDRWLADPSVKTELKDRLKRVQEIRAYAARELGLPDNGSYKNYAQLNNKYVMWNVVATPELSIKPSQWCFPIAGCVDYRGYYSQAAAQSFADSLHREGFDVRVSGVPAYSTLGWFDDPVLSTFIAYPDAEVARLVFHELAHQVAYAPGDSQFNESFATAVEEIGVARWLATQADASMRDRYLEHSQRKTDFLDLLMLYRRELEVNFVSTDSQVKKRQRKAQIFQSLKAHYELLKQERWQGYAGYDNWFNEPLSNANFALVTTYHDLVPAFKQLLAANPDMRSFYQSVRELARLDKKTRRERLQKYLAASAHALPESLPASAALQ